MKRFFTVLLMLFVLTGLVACKEEHEHCATDNLENNDITGTAVKRMAVRKGLKRKSIAGTVAK